MIDITCPHCKGMLQAESVSPGMVMECPLCGKKFTLPYDRAPENSSGGFFARFKKGNRSGRTRYFFGRLVCVLMRLAACIILFGGGYLIISDFNIYRLARQKIQAEHDVPDLDKINRKIDNVNKTWSGTVEILSFKRSRSFDGKGLTISDAIKTAYLEQIEDLNEVQTVEQAREAVKTFNQSAVEALRRLLADHLNKRLAELEKYADDSNRGFVFRGQSGSKISYSYVNNVNFYQKTEEAIQRATIDDLLRMIEDLKAFVDHEKISINGFDGDCSQMTELLKFLRNNCFSTNIHGTVGRESLGPVVVQSEENPIKARIRERIEALRINIRRLTSGWQVSAELEQLDSLLRERKKNLEDRDLALQTQKAEYIRAQVKFCVGWILVMLLILGGADALQVWFDFGDHISKEEN